MEGAGCLLMVALVFLGPPIVGATYFGLPLIVIAIGVLLFIHNRPWACGTMLFGALASTAIYALDPDVTGPKSEIWAVWILVALIVQLGGVILWFWNDKIIAQSGAYALAAITLVFAVPVAWFANFLVQ